MVQKPDRSKGRVCGFQGRVGLSAGAFLVRSPASFFAEVRRYGVCENAPFEFCNGRLEAVLSSRVVVQTVFDLLGGLSA